jgi:cyclophilin family peptidyl-prolyl cis-trans isomerase
MFSFKLINILPILLMLSLVSACAFAPTGSSNTPAPVREVAPTAEIGSTPTQPHVATVAAQVEQEPEASVPKQYLAPPPLTIDAAKTYTATLFTNKGELVLDLFASESTMTVNNFVFLAREGFYDGVTFHRIMKDFMVQGGDPSGNGSGGPGYRFADEPVTRPYTKGTLAMANAGPDTNGSQFFIVHAANPDLRSSYTIFGEVASGIDVLDAIASTRVGLTPHGEASVPLEQIIIESIEIEEGP